MSAGSAAKADSLTFSNVVALQSNGNIKVDLFANPGVTLQGPTISFLVDINGTLAPGETDTLLVTYQELGGLPVMQSFQIPAFGVIPPPFQQLFSFTTSATPFSAVAGTLTLDILATSPDFILPSGPNVGQHVNSYSYSFNVVQPVPEPTTLLLFGSAVSSLGVLIRRRLQR